MKRSEDRILTSHAGSLHLPPDLQTMLFAEWARDPHEQSQPHEDKVLAERLREAVIDVVAKQAGLGIDVVGDGEFSKSTWMGYVTERIAGFELRTRDADGAFLAVDWTNRSKDQAEFREFYTEAPSHYVEPAAAEGYRAIAERMNVVCTGPLKYAGHDVLQRDIANLREAVGQVDVEEAFLPVAAPGSVQPWIKDEHYADDEALFAALADALKEEYRAIVEAGFICQIDDGFLTWEWDRRLLEEGWDLKSYRAWAELAVEALNHAIDGLPEDRLRYHVCWGAWNGPHATDIPLSDVVDLVLKINAQTYSFEAANARHEWEYRVWEDVKLPDGKILMPGVIEHATNVIEHPRTVAERILRFARLVGRENVIAGTDCGFRYKCHPQIAWAKLGALGEGSKLASAELWK